MLLLPFVCALWGLCGAVGRARTRPPAPPGRPPSAEAKRPAWPRRMGMRRGHALAAGPLRKPKLPFRSAATCAGSARGLGRLGQPPRKTLPVQQAGAAGTRCWSGPRQGAGYRLGGCPFLHFAGALPAAFTGFFLPNPFPAIVLISLQSSVVRNLRCRARGPAAANHRGPGSKPSELLRHQRFTAISTLHGVCQTPRRLPAVWLSDCRYVAYLSRTCPLAPWHGGECVS